MIHRLPLWARRHALVRLWIKLFPASREQVIEFNGAGRICVDLADPDPRNYFLTKSFDPEFFEIATPFLSRGGTFFDCGANVGFCTFGLVAIPHLAGVQFHLFEANPQLVPLLRKSRALYAGAQIEITPGCLSSGAGSSRLSIATANSGRSFISLAEGEMIPNVVLDEYIDGHRITEVTFMKLDIEGQEPVALRGLLRSFQRRVVQALYLEVSPLNLERAGFAVHALLELLRENEFALFLCKRDDLSRMPDAEWFFCDINSFPLRLASMTAASVDFQTDLLAIDTRSRFFAMIEDSKVFA